MSIKNIIEFIKDLPNIKIELIDKNSGIKNGKNDLEESLEKFLIKYKIPFLSNEQFKKICSKELKQQIVDSNNNSYKLQKSQIKNIPEISYVKQPFGTQNTPDFLILININQTLTWICIECKSSNGWKSMWNCSLPLPRDFWIYIHLNKSEEEIFYTKGTDIITEDEYKALKNIHENIKKIIEKDMNDEKIKNKMFDYYPRPMYNQRKSYNIKENNLYK